MAKLSRRAAVLVSLVALSVVAFAYSRESGKQGAPAVRPASVQTAEVKVGETPPDFTLTTLDGKQQYRLSDLKGRPVAVLFWTSWCPHCAREAPDLEKLYQQYKPQGFLVLGVGLDDPDALARKADALKLTYPIGFDPEVGRTYGVGGVPHTFIVDRKGKLSASIVGEQPFDVMDAAVKKVL